MPVQVSIPRSGFRAIQDRRTPATRVKKVLVPIASGIFGVARPRRRRHGPVILAANGRLRLNCVAAAPRCDAKSRLIGRE